MMRTYTSVHMYKGKGNSTLHVYHNMMRTYTSVHMYKGKGNTTVHVYYTANVFTYM